MKREATSDSRSRAARRAPAREARLLTPHVHSHPGYRSVSRQRVKPNAPSAFSYPRSTMSRPPRHLQPPVSQSSLLRAPPSPLPPTGSGGCGRPLHHSQVPSGSLLSGGGSGGGPTPSVASASGSTTHATANAASAAALGGGGHLELSRQLLLGDASSFETELAKLDRLAQAFYDALDRAVDVPSSSAPSSDDVGGASGRQDGSRGGGGDPEGRIEALKAVQQQLAQLATLARTGLGAIPVPFPPPPLAAAAVATAAAVGTSSPAGLPTTAAAALPPSSSTAEAGLRKSSHSGNEEENEAAVEAPTLDHLTARWAADLPALFGRRQAFREAVAVADGVLKRVG